MKKTKGSLSYMSVDGFNWHMFKVDLISKIYDKDYYEINQQLYYEQIITK